MLSPQARVTKRIIRASSSKKTYTTAHIGRLRRNFERNLSLMFPSSARNVEHQIIAGVPVDSIKLKTTSDRVIVYLHGGGFILGSPKSHRQHIKRLAKLCRATVFAIDYSLAPESPYPAALEEITRVWRNLLANKLALPEHTVFMGDSAGGNLALASLLRFRNKNIPMPACTVLLSPGLDATLSGESYQHNSNVEPLLNHAKLKLFVNAYAGKAPKDDPLVSPVFANLRGLPPMLVHVGSDELLLSDSLTITNHARRDNVDVSLLVSQGMWHGWHFFASYVPEAKAAMRGVAEFVKQHS